MFQFIVPTKLESRKLKHTRHFLYTPPRTQHAVCYYPPRKPLRHRHQ